MSFGDLELRGHSIECRINAEHPETFRPSPGNITKLRWPAGPGVRIDTAIYEGYAFPPFYDSLMAKLVVWAIDRSQAIERLARALDHTTIEGVDTTLDLHRRIVGSTDFAEGRLHTSFVDQLLTRGRSDKDQSSKSSGS